MTFDDQLKRAFDTMSERLRAAVDQQVEGIVQELAAVAKDEREYAVSEAREAATREATGVLESATATARREAHEEGLAAGKAHGREEGLEEGRQQGFEEGRRQGVEEGRQQGVLDGRQQGLLEGRQQAEQEGREALEAAVMSVRAEQASAPDTSGDAERLAESVRAIAGGRSLTEILDTLVSCAGRESGHAGVWIIRGGRLRHWSATGNDPAEADLPLDDSGPVAEAARTNAVATRDGRLAVPIAMAGQVVAVLFAHAGATPGAIEIMAGYAARCLEALTAFKAARALTERPGDSRGESRAASHDAMVEEETSARRYARLLVSEIKLYHEAAVVDGRRDRDLATRLGGEIARARVLYEQRVPPEVRRRADFFHDELVRTLANGDATLLQLT